jgi:sRNA-binding regulator protein Hfq
VGALVGSALLWGQIGTFPIPSGLIIDLATGALVKPNTMENGVSKEDYKNFKYTINYTGCSSQDKWQSNKFDNGKSNNVSNENLKTINTNTHTDEVYLKNGGIIKGFIMEQVPSLQMKIQTNDGNIFVYKVDEIQKTISNLNASCTDIIYLKNGSILKGRTIEETPGVQVKFQTKDGNIFVYEAERVEKIIREGK